VFAWYEYIDEKKCKVGELENSKEKGWWRGYHNLDDYEKGDKEEVCTWILQIRVIQKTSDIKTKLFECGGVYDGVWATNDTLWINRTPVIDYS